jgi:hypothetical protein
LEERVTAWVWLQHDSGARLTPAKLIQAAKQMASELKLKNFSGTSTWYKSFLRHNRVPEALRSAKYSRAKVNYLESDSDSDGEFAQDEEENQKRGKEWAVDDNQTSGADTEPESDDRDTSSENSWTDEARKMSSKNGVNGKKVKTSVQKGKKI